MKTNDYPPDDVLSMSQTCGKLIAERLLAESDDSIELDAAIERAWNDILRASENWPEGPEMRKAMIRAYRDGIEEVINR